jgi:hypothetical protein
MGRIFVSTTIVKFAGHAELLTMQIMQDMQDGRTGVFWPRQGSGQVLVPLTGHGQ